MPQNIRRSTDSKQSYLCGRRRCLCRRRQRQRRQRQRQRRQRQRQRRHRRQRRQRRRPLPSLTKRQNSLIDLCFEKVKIQTFVFF